MVSLVSVSWVMRAITPSSRLRVIQSSWPSGPATKPSTVICTCSLSFRIAIRDVLVVDLTYGDAKAQAAGADDCRWRSEEHTSELQSRGHLVCRLLLEKKK